MWPLSIANHNSEITNPKLRFPHRTVAARDAF
jgi:hypothetical protein